MKFLLPSLFLILSAPGFLRANLGETETAIHKRYGAQTGPGYSDTNRDITESFKYKDYVVGVKLLDGTSQRETFTKKDKSPFTDKELEALLEANAGGVKWVMVDDNKDVKIWVQESRTVFAGYYKKTPYLCIQTRDMLAFDETVRRLKEKERQMDEKKK